MKKNNAYESLSESIQKVCNKRDREVISNQEDKMLALGFACGIIFTIFIFWMFGV